TSNIAEAVTKTDYYQESKMIFISPTVSASVFFGKDDALLTMIDVNEKQGALLARKAIADGTLSMAIVYEETNSIYTEPLTTSFQEEFQQLGGEVVYTNHFATSKDAPFDKLAQEIVDSKAKGVLLAAGGMDASQLSQYLFKFGSHQQIFTGMWSRTEDFIKNGSMAVERAYSISTYDMKNLSPSGIGFVKDYLKQFGYEPVFSAFHSFDVTQLLIQKIIDNQKLPLQPQSVKEAIINLDHFEGSLGVVSFDENGDCKPPYLVVQVMNGMYEKVIQP
ncbi:MAG: ABC transporter substrate-binding protein, partial [Vallitaleaceae bacterium]|nr:ABC transporter substrate-binding protein [Vallitaleaceae bacterium]